MGKFKKFLKKFLALNYYQDGRCKFFLKLPLYTEKYNHILMPLFFKFDPKIIYSILYAREPIQKNKIVFDNYMGKGFGCNPKYVALKLLEKYPDKFDIVWLATKNNMNDFPKGIRVVDYADAEAKREFATAKVWVSNYHKISFIKKGMFKKEGQKYIQMWHGSLGIKRIENDANCLTVNKAWTNLAKYNSRMTDYYISNSDFETSVYKSAFWNPNKILKFGHPRNDILINENSNIKEKVLKEFGIEDKKILFYAPTFREDYRLDCYRINYNKLIKVLTKKFGGDWVVFTRLHPRVQKFANKIIPHNDKVFDATDYPDIQELLVAADCMITDYSSCIFDYILTYRPAFIYATDLYEYNTERGFYYSLEDTPFPIAKDNFELIKNIEDFDLDSYKVKCKDFLKEKGCMDDGMASERVADLIAKIVEE